MEKPELFIQISVLEQHFINWCKHDSMSSIEKVENNTFLLLGKLNDLLFNSVNLIIDKDIVAYTENPFLKHLIKKSIQGSIEITCWDNFNIDIIEDDRAIDFPHAIFVLDISDEESEKYSNKFGQLICNYSSFISNLPFLINSYSFLTNNKVTSFNWNHLLPEIKFNKLFIIDNYILDDKEKLKYNILSLLNYVIEKNNKHLSEIIIITCLETRLLESRLSIIKEQINLIQNIEIKILNLQDAITEHDRAIITNYHYISSGKGFVFFNKIGNMNVKTKIDVHGILSKFSDNTICEMMNEKLNQVKEWCNSNSILSLN
jgi:hypothetical protein